MKCKKFKNLIVDYITDTITGKDKTELIKHTDECNRCNEEFQELTTANMAVVDYFKQVKVPYNSEMEEKLVEHIVTGESSFFSYLKRVFWQLKPILKPVMIISFVIVMFLAGIQGYSTFQKNKVIKKISSIIDLKEETMDFVVYNNIDYVFQLYIQEDNDIEFINEEDVYSGIKNSLYIYLSVKIPEDYFNENWHIINSTLDKYTIEYYNFIKENHYQILI